MELPCTPEHTGQEDHHDPVDCECISLEKLAEKTPGHRVLVGLLSIFSAAAINLANPEAVEASESEPVVATKTAELPLPLKFFLSRPGPRCMKNMIDIANAAMSGYHQSQLAARSDVGTAAPAGEAGPANPTVIASK